MKKERDVLNPVFDKNGELINIGDKVYFQSGHLKKSNITREFTLHHDGKEYFFIWGKSYPVSLDPHIKYCTKEKP